MKETELKLIDDYFQNQLSDSERIAIESRIKTDNEFAELMALFTSSKAILRENNLKNKHQEWNKPTDTKTIIFNPKVVIGLAASLLVFFGIWSDKPIYILAIVLILSFQFYSFIFSIYIKSSCHVPSSIF